MRLIFFLEQYVSYERYERSKKYIKLLDRCQCILGELLLKYILLIHYNIPLSEVYFKYNEFGKPYLSNHTNLYFNISHTNRWVVCAVSDSPIGVDIEALIYNGNKIARRFFSIEESNHLESLPFPNQSKAITKIWTLKECYLKCIGTGLTIPMNSFYFDISNPNRLMLYRNNVNINNYFFYSFSLERDLFLALCSEKEEKLFNRNFIINISISKLYNFYMKNDREECINEYKYISGKFQNEFF